MSRMEIETRSILICRLPPQPCSVGGKSVIPGCHFVRSEGPQRIKQKVDPGRHHWSITDELSLNHAKFGGDQSQQNCGSPVKTALLISPHPPSGCFVASAHAQ